MTMMMNSLSEISTIELQKKNKDLIASLELKRQSIIKLLDEIEKQSKELKTIQIELNKRDEAET